MSNNSVYKFIKCYSYKTGAIVYYCATKTTTGLTFGSLYKVRKKKRLKLSEITKYFFRYIEGLQADNKHITNWEKTLCASQENMPTLELDKIQNVTTWLGKKINQQDNVVSALWTLRNRLLRDTLSLQKYL